MEQTVTVKRTYVKKEKHEFYRALDITPTELANYLGFSRQYVVKTVDKIANNSQSLIFLKNALTAINTDKTNRTLKALKAYCDEKSINIKIDLNEENLSPMDRIKSFIDKEIISEAMKKDIDRLKEFVSILDYLNKYQS